MVKLTDAVAWQRRREGWASGAQVAREADRDRWRQMTAAQRIDEGLELVRTAATLRPVSAPNPR